MQTIDNPSEQERIVGLLVDEHDLLEVCAAACRDARVHDHEQQVAYCLAVLCLKRHGRRAPSTTPGHGDEDDLDPAAEDFGDRLRLWARTIADNVRAWGDTYTAIQDEIDAWRTDTIEHFVRRAGAGDDILTAIADKIVAIICDAPRLADMSLAAARSELPTAKQYTFQGALDAWIAIITKHELARIMGSVDPADHRIVESRQPAQEEVAELVRDETYRLLIAHLATIARTEGMLDDAIGYARDLQLRADDVRLGNAEDRECFTRVRAQLADVVNELRFERRDFGQMLAYLALALGGRTRIRRRVAILSLRREALEVRVREAIAMSLREIAHDDAQPTRILVAKTERAVARGTHVPDARLAELTRLRDGGARRAERLEELRTLLDVLPPSVADLAAIAAAIKPGMTMSNVSTVRHSLAAELGEVDRTFERSFRRYAGSFV